MGTATGTATATASASATGSGGAGGGDASACGTVVEGFPILPSPHIPVCFPVTYPTNPPTSGPHYPIWAAFQTYTTPVQRGFWVHDMEHGAVVIAYNCPNGCAAEVASLQAFVDTLPVDPGCTPPVLRRVVITPDPLLDVPFAAAAWGFALKSQCFDLPALGAFVAAHYAMGPEDFCFNGTDVTAADAGLPVGCGDAPDGGAADAADAAGG
jgi:Protein of unknown function (DUF3105)